MEGLLIAEVITTANTCTGPYSLLACNGPALNGSFEWGNLSPSTTLNLRFYRYDTYFAPTTGRVKICATDIAPIPAINSIGKVGIGIDAPYAKLDVAGNSVIREKLYVTSDISARANLLIEKNLLFNNSTNGINTQSGNLQFFTSNASQDFIFGTGSSNSIAERLHIINNGSEGLSLNGRLHLKNGTADINNGGGVWLYKADNTGLLSFMGTQNNQNIGFYGGSGGWGFVYDAINSRVGIGTASPTSSLNVNGQITVDQKNFGGYGGLLLKGNIPGSNYPNIGFSIKNNADADVVTALISGNLENNTAGAETIDLTFQTSQTGQGGITEKMRIKGNGNVGIGNSNPTQPLSFSSSIGKKISFYQGGTGEYGMGVWSGELRLYTDLATGKVSFGVDNYSSGYTELGFFQRNSAYALSVLGSIWANSVTYASDERFKQNISSIQSPLQKLMLLNGVEYEMKKEAFPKNNFVPGRQIGLLAQNVEQVFPEAVSENSDGYKGVDYARLVPLLIEAMKAMEKQIEVLTKQVNKQ
jgi:hypothetical protein